MAEDRAGVGVGNGDLIVALLCKDPKKSWNQAKMKNALKLSDEAFDEAVLELGAWVKLDPANKAILMNSDRTGAGVGNGYWAGDDSRFKAAWKAVEDRTGAGVGNG